MKNKKLANHLKRKLSKHKDIIKLSLVFATTCIVVFNALYIEVNSSNCKDNVVKYEKVIEVTSSTVDNFTVEYEEYSEVEVLNGEEILNGKEIYTDEEIHTNIKEEVVSLKSDPNMQLVENENREIDTIVYNVDAVLTFYTDLPSENGGYTVTAVGKKHHSKTIAAPKEIPIGTTIDCGRYGKRVVDDRGGAIKFDSNGRMKLDVYIARQSGETDEQYYNRVNSMGVIYDSVKVREELIEVID